MTGSQTSPAHGAGAPTVSRAHPVTIERHNTLDAHLGPTGDQPADPAWTVDLVASVLATAGIEVAGVTITVDPDHYQSVTGCELAAGQLGSATRHPAVLYICPHGTRTEVSRLVAPEITHLTHWSLGHRAGFFERVQDLLDRHTLVGTHPAALR